MAVSLDQAVQQIMQLGDAITKLRKDVQDLQGEMLIFVLGFVIKVQGRQGKAAARRSRNCVR